MYRQPNKDDPSIIDISFQKDGDTKDAESALCPVKIPDSRLALRGLSFFGHETASFFFKSPRHRFKRSKI